VINKGLISKIESVLSLSPDEEVVDVFKPIRHGDVKGILILTNKQVIFVEEMGVVFKSYKAVFFVKLQDLAEIQKLSVTDAESVKLGEFEVSSPNIEGLAKFFNDRIFPQVQRSKGLVEYKGKWMTPEERFEREQSDRGLVKFKGEWMTPEEKFEREQLDKGLVKYKGSWMTPEEKIEKEMLDKGLVRYKGQWMTLEEKFEQEQRDKGLLKFMGRWGTPEQVDKWKKLYAGLTSDFMDRSPHEFEDFIAELFTRMDYSTERTPLTSDYGADVIAKKGKEVIAIQVKRNKPGNDVGVKDVNQVLGSMYRYKADKAIVITTSDFTSAARKLATTAPVNLWNRTKLYEMIERYYFGESRPSITSEIFAKKREAVKWSRKALNLMDLGRYEDAIEAWDWYLEFTDLKWFKAIAEAWNNKGVCLFKLGRFEEAIKCYDKALEINPSLQITRNNKAIIQKQIEESHVKLREEEEGSKVPVSKTVLEENLNLTAKGKYSEMTILHVVENNEFQCPKTCTYYDRQDDHLFCPKSNLMTLDFVKDRLVCTTVLVRVKNVSSQLLALEPRSFLAFDSFGNQYIGKSLCFELHPKKYARLGDGYSSDTNKLYGNAQVTCLLCFPQLPSDSKIVRMVYENRVYTELGYITRVETQDIKIIR